MMRARVVLRFTIVAVLLVSFGPAGAVPKDLNQLLRGDFAFTGEAACLTAVGGFTPQLVPIGSFSVVSFSVHGVRTFNGDGTGTVAGRSVSVRHFSGPSGSATDFSATFTYTVNPDLTFTTEHDSVALTFTAGPRTGQSATITALAGDPIIPLVGRISEDLKTLTIATDTPTVEVVNFAGPPPAGPPPFVDKRICHRARTAIKLKGGN